MVTMGLGIVSEYSRRRIPNPPQNSTTFIDSSSALWGEMDTISVLVFPNVRWLYFSDFKDRAIPIARARLSRDSCSDNEARMNRPRSFSRGLGLITLEPTILASEKSMGAPQLLKPSRPLRGQIAATQGPQWWATVRRKLGKLEQISASRKATAIRRCGLH